MYARYWAINASGVPVSGDAAHHKLAWVKDGVASPVTNTPAEITFEIAGTTYSPGEYQVLLTQTEADCLNGHLAGVSSTSGVRIVGVEIAFDLPPATLAAAMLLASAAGVEGSTIPLDSLAAFLRGFHHSDLTTHPGYLTIFKSNGSELGQIRVAVNSAAEPIVGVGGT